MYGYSQKVGKMKLIIILSLLSTSIHLYAKNIIWDKIDDKKSILFKDKNSFATIIIIEEDERYNSIYFLMNNYNLIDISKIEQQNLMAISSNIKKYDKVKTIITRWIDLNDKYIITFLTVTIKSGKELSTKQPLIIKKTGKVLWR